LGASGGAAAAAAAAAATAANMLRNMAQMRNIIKTDQASWRHHLLLWFLSPAHLAPLVELP